MSSLFLDLRYSLRMMAKTPGLTAILAITLAIGIGASTTIFSVVSSVVLRDLPYEDPGRIVRVYTEYHSKSSLHHFAISVPEIRDLQQNVRSCSLLAAWAQGSAPISGGDRPVRLQVGYATHQLLPLLGVPPLLGRWFDAEEDAPGTPSPGQLVGDPSVVVINYDVWQRAFGGDPQIIGKKVQLDALPVTVVGVMPRGFKFDDMEAWVPARFDFSTGRRASHFTNVVCRLAPGVSLGAFQSELSALSKSLGPRDTKEFHSLSETHPVVATPFQQDLVGSLATTLWLLQGAVLFVLMISIVNIANLLLARAETRTREVAVRHALGASRRRLVRQFVTESLVLGLLGGGLGILVSVWALDGVTAMIPKSAPRASEIRLDSMSVLFAVGCSVFASLLFGLAPILHAKKTDLHGALKDGSNRMTGSKARLRARRVLVIVEIALALLLVIGCSVMVRSFVRLQRVELGFKPDHVLTFGVNIPLKTYEPTATHVFWNRLEARLRALPGVESATLLDGLPPDRSANVESFHIVGKPEPQTGDTPWTTDYWQTIGARGVSVLGGRIVRGRDFDDRDAPGAPRVILVNEAFAKKFFPGEDAVGQQLALPGPNSKDIPVTIVGIVADMKNAGVDRPAGTEVFAPRAQLATVSPPPGLYWMYAAVRTNDPPTELIPAVHRVVADLDPSVPLHAVRTFDDLMWESVARPRFLTFLLTSFAIVALLLAAVGIYGVMAHTVVQRTHEIGLRMALGAHPAQVRAMVLRQAASLVATGVAIGLGAAVVLQLALEKPLVNLFYGEKLSNPVLLAGVAIAVAATALFATWIPARRATKVEPTVALRSE
ncbi:MAG: ABC transporter permease [Kofleriaceae bacterium]|nr:ABC transporter permease [Kofleriaceae bacterium]